MRLLFVMSVSISAPDASRAAGRWPGARHPTGGVRIPVLGALLVAAFVLGGCASRAPALHSVIDEAPAELVETPFFPQTELHCGPAALATVLVDSGVRTTPHLLSEDLFVPERGGTLQTELLAQARARGRIPVRLEGRMQAIADALAAGYPVLVLQNRNSPAAPAWHYAVVVALEPENETVVLRSGAEARKRESAAFFMRSWSLAGRWAFVVAPPERIPPFLQEGDWLLAASAAETSSRQLPLARRAYRAATKRWPDSPLTWFALGNARHLQGDGPGARAAWRAALEQDPDFAPARENLALTAQSAGTAGQ